MKRMFGKHKNSTLGVVCSCCGKVINEAFPAYTFDAPDYWRDEFANDTNCELTTDTCVINADAYFVRCVLDIPINDYNQPFSWGVWASVSKDNFNKYLRVYGTRKELKELPYFGWLSNQLPGYRNTLKVKCNIVLQGKKDRPKLILDHTSKHKLCKQQCDGITLTEAHALNKSLVKHYI